MAGFAVRDTDLDAGDVTVEPVAWESVPSNWDRFLERAPHGTFYHRAGWAPLLAEVMGVRPLYRVARDRAGRWAGVLPLVEVRSRLFGHYLVSMPFLNAGGPVGAPAARRRLAEEAAREARERRADLLELRLRSELEAGSAELRPNPRKVTVLLELPDDPGTLFHDTFRAKLRSQIRRPLKEGMETRFGTGQVEPFLQVFQRTMRDLGTPVLPAELFRRLPETFGRHVTFGAVYLRDEPVAAGCGFSYRGAFELVWAGSLRLHRRKSPNMLLYWSFMRWCIENGIRTFDFGRCTPGGGGHRFKIQWGGEEVPLPWLQWSRGDTEATPSPESEGYDLAIRAWQRLPLGVANRVGPILARRIP